MVSQDLATLDKMYLTPRRTKYFYSVTVAISIGVIFLCATRRYVSSNAMQTKRLESNHSQYKIVVWNFHKETAERFFFSYRERKKDPFASCSLRNCVVEASSEQVDDADAVIFHLQRTTGPYSLPKFRKHGQYWVFFTDESPFNTFDPYSWYGMSDYNGLFNLSMTYRLDSDVHVPYGRAVSLQHPPLFVAGDGLRNFSASKDKLVSVLISQCEGKNKRWLYIKELSRHIKVDIYGACGYNVCPEIYKLDCDDATKGYMFYLAFENSNCKEYITEKLWWHSYSKELVPVVMGASKEEYARVAPPHSFIHVQDFRGPAELAKYLWYLHGNASAYNEYFEWKTKYKVLNEHGYFGTPSLHLCRMCEALNRPGGWSKVYTDLGKFWNSETDCRPPTWTPT